MPTDAKPPLERLAWSISEASKTTGLSIDKIRDEIRSGRLRARKVGRRTVITRDDLNRWLAQLPVLVVYLILVLGALLAVATDWHSVASLSNPTGQYGIAQPRPSQAGFLISTINFAAINRAAMAALPSLLARWAPGGRVCGSEYVALNPVRDDRSLGSFKVNLRTGKWADFATGDKGGDPISLAAYLAGTGQREAARNLAKMLKLSDE